jgi:hypothetical protein
LTIVVAFLAAGCGDSAPVTTSLSALSRAQSDFDGRKVIVSGTLRTFESPKHYWIENDSLDRVALQNVDDLSLWVGRAIEVRGTFLYDLEAGRRIEVEDYKLSP